MWKQLKGYYLMDKCPLSNEMKPDGNSWPSSTAEVKESGAGLLQALGYLQPFPLQTLWSYHQGSEGNSALEGT